MIKSIVFVFQAAPLQKKSVLAKNWNPNLSVCQNVDNIVLFYSNYDDPNKYLTRSNKPRCFTPLIQVKKKLKKLVSSSDNHFGPIYLCAYREVKQFQKIFKPQLNPENDETESEDSDEIIFIQEKKTAIELSSESEGSQDERNESQGEDAIMQEESQPESKPEKEPETQN